MSMIGVLINNLNKSADEWNGSNMFELAHMCRDAADTIWQLRDDLQRANTEKAALEKRIDELCAENERLRQLADGAANEADRLTHDAAALQIENANLRAENARLRKLLLDVWNDAILFDDFWDYVMDDGELYNKDELPHYQERMRELGIEVN